jgi:activator of Hsp90 ATPase-like protein
MTEPDSVRHWLGDVELRIRKEEPESYLELDWEVGGRQTLVRIELQPSAEGTVLVLDHSRLLEPQGMTAINAWTNALARLQSMLGEEPE